MAGIGEYKAIKLMKYSSTVNGNGDSIESVFSYRLWAEVTDNGGSRSQVSGRTTLSGAKQFKIRFRPDWVLNGDWKISYFGQVYAISNIERIGEKRFNWLITANVQS